MSRKITLWIEPDPAGGGDRIYTRTPFELKDAMKALPGRRWDSDLKSWHIPADAAHAGPLMDVCLGWQVEASPEVEALFQAAQADRERHPIKHADDLPDIPGRMAAWLHQKRAYHFAFERAGTMLAMDMGTGKSRTAVSLLDGWGAGCAVILCPRSVVGVWPNQFTLHSEREWVAIHAPGNMTVAKRAAYVGRQITKALVEGKPFVVIVNYEAAWREPMASTLKQVQAAHAGEKVLILDECHRIKSAGGKASRYASQLAGTAQRVLGLTGTPMPHSPMDVYAQFRAIDPTIYGTSHTRFRARYAVMGGFEQRQVVAYQNLGELTEKFAQASYVVHKSEAGLDLPPVVHTERRFDLSPKSLRAYKLLEENLILGVEDGTVTVNNALTHLLRLQQVTSGFVKDDEGVEHQVGTDKIDVLADVLEDVPTDEPVVVFARFKHDLAIIRELCEKQGRRVGELSGAVKLGQAGCALNEHSQMRDDIDVAIIQLQSGGVGIDLTRSAFVVYYSLDFNLGNYLQSLARTDRPGQKRSTTYVHLVAEGTKDVAVYRALSKREDVVNAVLDASKEIGREAA